MNKRASWNIDIPGKIVGDVLTWAVRTCVPVIAWAIWTQVQSNARLEQGQAVMSVQIAAVDQKVTTVNQKVDAHTTELQRMWTVIGDRRK